MPAGAQSSKRRPCGPQSSLRSGAGSPAEPEPHPGCIAASGCRHLIPAERKLGFQCSAVRAAFLRSSAGCILLGSGVAPAAAIELQRASRMGANGYGRMFSSSNLNSLRQPSCPASYCQNRSRGRWQLRLAGASPAPCAGWARVVGCRGRPPPSSQQLQIQEEASGHHGTSLLQ